MPRDPRSDPVPGLARGDVHRGGVARMEVRLMPTTSSDPGPRREDVTRAPCGPVLVDLYCKAGGMTKGYQRAGFHVIGVDIEPQPNYCGDEFIECDALVFLSSMAIDGPCFGVDPRNVTAYSASPPCQHYLNLGAVNRAMGRKYDHPDLIDATRHWLDFIGKPYVIENGPDARKAMIDPVRICGTGLDLPLRRHRLFESNVPLDGIPCAHHRFTERRYWTGWRPNGEHRLATVVQVYGNAGGRSEWPAAMGIDWMTSAEMIEAIPPAYAEHVGHQLMRAIREGREPALSQSGRHIADGES